VSTVEAVVGRDAGFTCHSVSLSGALIRNDLGVRLAAAGAGCRLFGLFLTRGGQHVDNHTLVLHETRDGTSRELYKGILDGESRGIFHGRIVVRPDAQHTDARQESKNLLLSDRAEIDTKPQLEIHADDVRCSHGSSIGSIDEDALFYLRSRGLDEATARGVLTRAFAAEVVDAIPVEAVRDVLGDWLQVRLGDAQEGSP
jgi:Fe-S cluster assembly protein SufD